MDIKVITRHAPSNYGSLLQSIATLKTIESLGHNCEIIDYIREDEKGLKGVITALKNKPAWYNNILKKILYIALRYPEEKIAQIKFKELRTNHLKLTSLCKTTNDLKKIKADVFMTGSDQVWGPILNGNYDSAYFLSFVDENIKKISYAASFGRVDFNSSTIRAYKKMLGRYNKITVREDSAIKTIENMGLQSPIQVLDPTLLLDKEQWLSIFNDNIKTAKDYILVYQIHNDNKLNDYAKNLAKYKNLPLYRVSPSFHQILRGGKFVYLPNISEFLLWINNAKYIVTDSFHGTCFSINFNKQFIEILPNTKTGSRNQSILNLTGLQDRIIKDMSDFSIADKEINYEKVNEIISRNRNNSINVLRELLNEY